MIFEEKKLKEKWQYKVKDIFGTLIITSGKRLNDTEKLDEVFDAIFKVAMSNTARRVIGDVKGNDIKYNFFKKNPWQKIKKSKLKKC